MRRDAASRNITVMVAVPGDRMSTELRIRLQELLAARFHAESVEYHLALAEDAAAQLFFLLHVPPGGAPDVPLDELEQEVARLARTWDDRLADELIARSGDAEGRRLAGALLRAAARLLQDRDARPSSRSRTSSCSSAWPRARRSPSGCRTSAPSTRRRARGR